MATDDFFLKFGSDADAFSRDLARDLGQGVSQINELTEALLRYDETVGQVRNAKNPLGNVFTNLDQAGAKLERIGSDLAGQFDKIINSVGQLSTELKEALEVVTNARLQVNRGAGTRQATERLNAQGFTAEQQRIIDAQRRGASRVGAVTDADIEAAASGRGKSPSQVIQARTMEQLNRDAVEARNSLRTVANASATVARNSRDASQGLKELGQSIRTLTTQTKTTTRGVTEGRFQQNTIVVQGNGGITVGAGTPVGIDELLSRAGVVAEQGPARDAAHQAERDRLAEREAERRNARALFDLNQPAVPGSYYLNGDEKQRLSISSRVNPGETVAEYQQRVTSNSRDLDRIRQQVRLGSETRLGTQQATQLGAIQNLIGRKGLEELLADPKIRLLQRTPGAVNAEQVRASVSSVLAPGQSLTPAQYAKVGEALADFQKRLEEFNALTQQYVRGKLAENPLESFTVAGRGDGGDVFGRNQDFYRVLAQYDQEHETQGAEMRAQQAAEQAQRAADVKLRTSGYVGLSGIQREQLRQEAERQAAKGRDTFIDPEEAAQQDRLAREAIEEARRQNETNRNLDERLRQTVEAVNDLTTATAEEATERRGHVGGGGGGAGRKPPKAPPSSNPEPGDGNGDENEERLGRAASVPRPRRSRARIGDQTISPAANEATLRALQDSTRAVLEEAKRLLPTATGQERRDILGRAGAAFQQDPLYASLPNAETRKRSFRDLLGLDPRGSYAEVNRALGRGGDSEQLRGINSLGLGSAGAGADEAARQARYEEILATSSGRVREALLAEFKAQERLNELRSSGRATALQLADATRQLEAATRTRQTAQQSNTPRSLQQQLFGQQGFAQNQLRHIGLGVENIIGYSLVFTGFEKLKELAHNGLEAQAAFVRLQATLDANGVSAGNLQTHLQGIASNTATPLENVIEAASELAGVFNNTGDLEFGTKIAAQLSNISQGTLTTKEAAIGLRDVIDAYGITGRASIQAVGDEIAHLSQITGVSVKDITEGTTQIAQEAREFGLTQHQASTLAAYVSRGTGESGEQSASQTSRMLSSLYNSQAQRQLISSGVATSQQFQSGDIAGVLQNLIEKYKDLAPAQRQAIAGLIGTGIQARAFSAIVNIGSQGLAEFNGQSNDMGALQRQNARVLQTIAGEVKQLDEDFQSLGSNLQRIGAFDFIGGLAKSLDLLLKLINATFGRIADLANSSPLTRIFLHATTTILEARAALLLFGTTLTGFLNRRLPTAGAFQPTNAAAVAARQGAIAAGEDLAPIAPIYNRPTLRGAARGGIRGFGSGFVGLANGGRAIQGARALAQQAEIEQRLRDESGIRQNAAGRFIGANGAFVSNARVAGIAGQAESEARVLGTNRLTRFGAGLQNAEGASSRAIAFGRVAERSGQALTGLGASVGGIGTSARSAIAGIGGFNLALLGVVAVAAIVTASLADASRRAKATASIRDEILGTNQPTDPAEANTPTGRAQTALNTARHTGILQGFFSTERNGPSIFNGNSGPSGKSQDDELRLVHDTQARLRAAYATRDPAKIAQAQQDIDAEIKSQADRIAKEGGNNKENQAEILASIQQLQDGIRQSADNRIKMLQGLQQVDILTQQQAVALTTLIQSAQGLTGEGIASNPNAIRTLFDQSGLNQNSVAGRQSLQALGINIDAAGQAHSTNSTLQQRLQGQLGALNTDISQQATDLTNPGEIAKLGGLQGDAYKALQQSLAQNIQTRAQIAQQLLDNQAQAGESGAGGLEALGNFTGAVTSMQGANQALEARLAQLDQSDPQYWTIFKQIQDNKTTLANLLSENANNALNLQASLTSDPVVKAQLALKAAQNVLANTPVVRQADLTTRPDSPNQADRGASAGRLARDNHNAASAILNTPGRTAAEIQANQNSLAVSQAQEALVEAQVAARNAGMRNQAAAAQLSLNETFRQEGVYAQGKLRDDTKLAQLQGQETQQRATLRDAIQQDEQAVFDARSALQKLHGNDVAAAQTDLAKAQNQYNYEVREYGKNSNEAQGALGALFQAQQETASAQLALITSRLDLQIAQLNARGQAGDAQRAANDEVAKARAALANYQQHGGQTGTAEYNKLIGDIATAQRTAFDTALNAQLDTLDFQRETYRITSAQEIASLQQILKNKQLTLAEQRSITLKIKDLQTSIREQLTQGGLNIPSDIKLPTAYEVRRSLGAGFGSSASTSVVNNNQKTSVVIQQVLPSSALANAVANQVISIINRSSGQALRANTTTPRLVPTR